MDKKYFKYIYIILLIYFIWLVVIPFGFRCCINPILDGLQTFTGMDIDIIKPRLVTSVLPNVKLKANKVLIFNKNGSEAMSLTKPRVNIRILPILTGKIHIKSFECSDVSTNFVLKDKLYLGDYVIEIPQKNPNSQIDRVKIKNIKVNLKEGNDVHLLNGKNIYYKFNRRTCILRGKTNYSLKNIVSKADFDINLPRSKRIGKTRFDINIENLCPEVFSGIVAVVTKNEIKSLNGVINVKSDAHNTDVNIKKLRVDYTDKNKSVVFPDVFNVRINHKFSKDSVTIEKLTAAGNGISTNIIGKINNIFSKAPKVDLKVVLNKTDIRKGALMLPPIVTPDISTSKLKEYPFYGTIEGKMNIVGKLPEPDIKGNIKVYDGVLIKPIPFSKSGAKIDIEFVGKKLLLDVYVSAGNDEVVTVDGDIKIYGDKFAHLNIKSTSSVDLNVTEMVLNPLHEILCFMIGPVPIMDVEGLGNIDIKIVGTKKDPHIWGDFNFKNAKASFIEVYNLALEHADGNLHFDNQKAHFVNKTGTLHGQKATVDGTCTLFGDLDFDVTANNQNLNDLIITLTTSPMLTDISSMVPPIKNVKGKSDFFLNLKGKLYDIKDLKLNENVFPKGFIKLNGNSMTVQNLNLSNIKGIINYNKKDCDFDLKSNVYSGYSTSVIGSVKNNIADVKINAPRLCVNELEPIKLKYLDKLFVKIIAHYKGKIDEIEIGGIDAVVDVLKDNSALKNAKILSGKIVIKNNNLKITNLKGIIQKNPFSLNLSAGNIGNKVKNLSEMHINGDFYCKDFELPVLNLIIKSKILPENIQKEIEKIVFKSGKTTIKAKVRNSRIDSVLNMNNADFEYTMYKNAKNEPVKLPIKLISGQIGLKNNTLNFNKLNCLVDEMPVLLFGQVINLYYNPQYNIRLNSKLVQKVFDKYWNAHNIYPIKINGDILFNSIISGNKNHTHIKSDIRMEDNSNIYYMGATIGDVSNPITVDVDADIEKSGLVKLNKFKYNKLIASHNNRQNALPILSVSGQIKPAGKIMEYKNLIVKTENPANANLFNIIFKKPTIKRGNFTSDLKINGTSLRPKIVGKLSANNMEMPYLNTVIKDLTIDFEPSNIQVITNGAVLENYMMLSANLKNNFNPPYRINNADIYINDFDIDHSLNQFKQIELKGLNSAISTGTDSAGVNIINSVLFNNVKVRAGNVRIKNIKASNLEALCSLNDKMQMSVESFKFNMASGTISGKIGYNLLNNYMQMELDAKDVNANSLTYALFDIQNQIYGSLTGHIDLNCNATDDKTRLTTLNGFGTFNVAKGRMPKLGSLEYLLRAGNLIKGGITNLSMNSIIDIITPMKTGEFSSINGKISIHDGVAKTIEIQTNGKNLNLYMIGSLNLYTSMADMHVFGQLSRKISTILGAAGNISLNTLFNKIPGISLSPDSSFINDLNKIPGIELTNKSNRKFMVEILGDINGDNFVKSFKWIN